MVMVGPGYPGESRHGIVYIVNYDNSMSALTVWGVCSLGREHCSNDSARAISMVTAPTDTASRHGKVRIQS